MACSIEHSAKHLFLIFVKLRHSLYPHCRLTLKALLMSCNFIVKRVGWGGGGEFTYWHKNMLSFVFFFNRKLQSITCAVSEGQHHRFRSLCTDFNCRKRKPSMQLNTWRWLQNFDDAVPHTESFKLGILFVVLCWEQQYISWTESVVIVKQRS